jgi:hypothetical protein
MKWLSKIALAVLAILGAAATILARMLHTQRERTEKAEAVAKENKEALGYVKERAEQLQKAAGETVKAEEKANDERKELAETDDADLVNRANNLFNL